MNPVHQLLILLLCVSLAGCAGQEAFRRGKQTMAEGKPEQAIAHFEQALAEDPENVEYRTQLVRARETLINTVIMNAERLRAAGRFDEADAEYQRVLRLESNNVRALAGLQATQIDRQQQAQLDEARELIKAGKHEAAQQKIQAVLSVRPQHREARALLREVDVKPKRELMPPALAEAFKKPITLEFRDANLRSVFEIISRTSGINFIFDKDVRPDLKATIFVRNSNIEEVINLLLATNQLDKKVLSENTVLVYPAIPAKQREYQELVVKSFYLTNADVKQTLNMIKTMLKTRDVFIDEKVNLLVMRDTPQAIRIAEKLIAAQDLAEPEVVLEVEVLEVSSNRLTELGLRFPDQVAFSVAGAAGVAGSLTLPEFHNRNSGMVTLSLGNPALLLNLKNQDGSTNLLANPRIRVKNREKAKIHIGERVPVITTTTTATAGTTSDSVTYQDVGIKLDVEPTIHLEREVGIKVGLEVTNINREVLSRNGTLTYQLGTRSAATTLRLQDGETQVLAGLISDEDRSAAEKVPALGDLPVVGRLFSSHRDQGTKTEVVLLITPRIVRALERPDAAEIEFASGTEASLGSAPLVLTPGGAPRQPRPAIPAPATPVPQATPTQPPVPVPGAVVVPVVPVPASPPPPVRNAPSGVEISPPTPIAPPTILYQPPPAAPVTPQQAPGQQAPGQQAPTEPEEQ